MGHQEHLVIHPPHPGGMLAQTEIKKSVWQEQADFN